MAAERSSPAFSDNEVTVMLQDICREKSIVFSQLNSAYIVKKKKEVWNAIAARVSAVGVASRTGDQLRQKWKDLKIEVLSRRAAVCALTERGPPPKTSTNTEQVMGTGKESGAGSSKTVVQKQPVVLVEDDGDGFSDLSTMQRDDVVRVAETEPKPAGTTLGTSTPRMAAAGDGAAPRKRDKKASSEATGAKRQMTVPVGSSSDLYGTDVRSLPTADQVEANMWRVQYYKSAIKRNALEHKIECSKHRMEKKIMQLTIRKKKRALEKLDLEMLKLKRELGANGE